MALKGDQKKDAKADGEAEEDEDEDDEEDEDEAGAVPVPEGLIIPDTPVGWRPELWSIWQMDGPTSSGGCHKLLEVKVGPSKRQREECAPANLTSSTVLPHGRDKAKKMLKMANGYDPDKKKTKEMAGLASAARKNSRTVDYATQMQARSLRLVELRTLYQLSDADAQPEIAETMKKLITAKMIAPPEHTPPEKKSISKSISNTPSDATASILALTSPESNVMSNDSNT